MDRLQGSAAARWLTREAVVDVGLAGVAGVAGPAGAHEASGFVGAGAAVLAGTRQALVHVHVAQLT